MAARRSLRRRVPLARRMLARDRARFSLTVAGVGVAVALVLFLFTVYQGALDEGDAYVASRPVDVWVSNRSSTSLVRSGSFLPASLGIGLETLPGVRRAAPLLRGIATTQIDGEPTTLFLLGIDPGEPVTRPDVVAGRADPGPGEVVVDRALARRHDLEVGDTLRLQEEPFRVAGLSRRTNLVVAGLVFVPLPDAQRLLGLEGAVSHFLVQADPGVPPAVVADTLAERFDELSAVTAARFVRANRLEIRNGVVPLLRAVTLFGALAGCAALTLLLYGGVVERRVDYAVLKAIGARQRDLVRLVLAQAAWAVLAGLAAGVALYGLLAPAFARLVPEIAYGFAPWIAWGTALAAAALGLAAAWLPIHRLRSVWPGEAFRP